LIAMLGFGCRSIAPLLPSVSPPAEDEEVRISREFRREAKKHFKFINQPEVERYVDRIARRIRRHASWGSASFIRNAWPSTISPSRKTCS
jgi:hypothetical protein